MVKFVLVLALAIGTVTTAQAERRGQVLFMIGEAEYQTARSLPKFAKDVLEPHGYECRFVYAKSDDRSSRDAHIFPGFKEALAKADVLFVSVRRRFPLKSDIDAIRSWVDTGKPVIGIRTSSHAFAERNGKGYTAPDGHVAWSTFDRDVFGVHYQNHYGNKPGTNGEPTTVIRQPLEVTGHPIMREVNWTGETMVDSHLYKSRDLDRRAYTLFTGRLQGQPATHEPIAWTFDTDRGRSFYTSLGSTKDLSLPWVRVMLRNAIDWLVTPAIQATASGRWKARPKESTSHPQPAAKSHASLRTMPDLQVDLLHAEPQVAQPAFLNFDALGRMWVVQYKQYPEPAGLKMISRDHYWRAQYDRMPAPPGHSDYVAGKDRITIHEDTNGDGNYDNVKTFIDNMSIVTGCVAGDDGVWVLTPPYLVFYPDADRDDQPDSGPEVHLQGFGLQDTHSVAAALCWGPDGWLYGCHGSTVASKIRVTGTDHPIVESIGQMIWRYHPTQRRYEVYAEGGGNIWSCEIDSKGRVFAGSNGGSPGFFYLQGGYYRKNFKKHGELSNPFAFGYLDPINHPGYQRVSCSIIIYEGATMPRRYAGSLMFANPIQGMAGASEIQRDGLRYQGRYLDFTAVNDDRWFRPVYTESGPDGAVYIADWYDSQVSHRVHYQGRISRQDGRLFRIRSKSAAPLRPFDLTKLSTNELVDVLYYANRWWRESARRLIVERDDVAKVESRLRHMLANESGQAALEALWVLAQCNMLDQPAFDTAIKHSNPDARAWIVRLTGDQVTPQSERTEALAKLAATETNLEVIGQLASTAKRLDVTPGLAIVAGLLARDDLPESRELDLMIWWAIETHCEANADAAVALYTSNRPLRHSYAIRTIPTHLTQRLASVPTRDNLLRCARLLRQVQSDPIRRELMIGIQQAYRGKPMVGLPKELVQAMADYYKGAKAPLVLRLRRQDPTAVAEAIDLLNSKAAEDERIRVIEVLGELGINTAVDAIINRLQDSEAVTLAALQAMTHLDSPKVGKAVTTKLPTFNGLQRDAAHTLLAGRVAWANHWLDSIERGAASIESVPESALADMRIHQDGQLNARLDRLFKHRTPVDNSQHQATIDAIKTTLAGPTGDPRAGKKLYLQRCATCHTLFADGGHIGPDLTPYQRNQLDSLLTAIVNPNAEIREGFETTTVLTKDARLIVGFVTERRNDVMVLRQISGGEVFIPLANVKSVTTQPRSLMPGGLLAGLNETQLRDLFSYLRSSQPVP